MKLFSVDGCLPSRMDEQSNKQTTFEVGMFWNERESMNGHLDHANGRTYGQSFTIGHVQLLRILPSRSVVRILPDCWI